MNAVELRDECSDDDNSDFDNVNNRRLSFLFYEIEFSSREQKTRLKTHLQHSAAIHHLTASLLSS